MSRAILAVLFILTATECFAESTDVRPRLFVPPFASVKGGEVHLGDIAKIVSPSPAFEKLVSDLKAVSLGDSPPPRSKRGIPGAKILSSIEAAGIPSDALGYSIPQLVTVEREGRVLTTDEVLEEVRAQLSKESNFDLQVRELNWEHAQILPAGAARYSIERLGEPSAGKLPLRVTVFVDDLPASRFVATAVVDDWREVPVLNRTLERGMLISPEDVEVVRLNLFKQPADVSSDIDEVVGKRVKTRINAGETVRRSVVDIPPLIPQGKKILMLFRGAGVTASATGMALDAGLKGNMIRVRNESSKRVVRAKVLTEEEVEVAVQ